MSHKLDVYLIRHTEPLIETGTCYGQFDCDVSDDYVEQLTKISAYFHDQKIDAIHSSPLQRCAILAEDLSKHHLNDSVIYAEALKEINFGNWEGIKWDDIPRTEIDKWNNNRLDFQFPSGETPSQFHSRVVQVWSELIALNQHNRSDKKLIIIAHAGVIRSILCHCLFIPFQHSTQLRIDYASISLLRLQKNISECHFVNKSLS